MRPQRRLLLWALGGSLLAWQSRLLAAEWNLAELMAQLAQVRSARARFVEKRYLSMLRAPLETMGVLLYQAPGRLEKIVQKPRAERMLLDGDRVTLEMDGGRRRKEVSLGEMPELAALVSGLRATLAGDVATLNRHFTVHFEGPPEHWRMTLTPSDAKAARLVKFIRIFGTGVDLTGVEVNQADGDRSVMLMVKDAG